MPSDAPVSQPWELPTAADLLVALDRCGLGHLAVNAHRTVVLYREVVFDFRVTDGTHTAAQTCTRRALRIG